MIEAFPLNVSSISLGWGQTNDYMKFSVTFSFRKWKKAKTEPTRSERDMMRRLL